MSSLKKTVFNGVIWTSSQRFIIMGVNFISSIVLARLLTPEDFGCIGMLMIFISLSGKFVDGGFGAALIQKKRPTQEDYSTIFYWNIIVSIVLYIILFVASPYISIFYRISLLDSVLKVQGLVLILNAFSLIQQTQLRKELQFRKLAVVNVISAVGSLVITIVLALMGWGVWSLVAQQLSMSVLNIIGFWYVSPWRPQLVFSFKSFKELFDFGVFMLLSGLFGSFSTEIQGLLIGRMFTPATLGLYNQAFRLEASGSTLASSILRQISYPVLASCQDDKIKLSSVFRRFTGVPAFICTPLMVLLIIVAKPLIVFLYSEKWIECVPYFQVLCTAGVAVCLQSVQESCVAAVGKSKPLFYRTVLIRTATILFCVIGIVIGGIYGLLWGCVIGAWFVFFANAYMVSRYVGYGIVKQCIDIIPHMIIALSLGLLVSLMGSLISFNMYLVAIIQAIAYIVFYLLLAYIFGIEALFYICSNMNIVKNEKK